MSEAPSRSALLAEMAGRIFTAMVAHYSPSQTEASSSELAKQAVSMASRLLAACESRAELEEAVQEATQAPNPSVGGVMDADRFGYVLSTLGWSYGTAGRQLGKSHQIIRRCAIGDRSVDREDAAWLERAVLFFELNPPPGRAIKHATTHPQETGDGE